MNVLLIDPPGWQKHSVNLGLGYLAGTLASRNVNVKILDLNNKTYTDEAIAGIIQEFQPRIIGISVKTATANAAARVAVGLKIFFPGVVYVAGGPHVTLCAEEYLKANKVFDFGIKGDGEIPFLELARYLMGKSTDLGTIKGLCYYKNDVLICNGPYVNGDVVSLAYPSFGSFLDIDFQDFRYPLLTSRGCPYGCIFCCVGAISGKKWRPREPEDVVRELVEAVSKYQITSFEIMDDNFTFDIDRARSICRLLINNKLDLEWWCHNGVRADKLDPELLGLMKKAGCKSIAIGIESGDPAVFDAVNKGEKLADIVKAVTMIKQAGMHCVGYFIVGLPGDSIASTKKTVKFQRDLQLFGHAYNIAIPYPGTQMAEHVRNNGHFLMDIQETYHFGDRAKVPFETNQLSKETLETCYFLANEQGWVRGEEDLQKIRGIYRSRNKRDAKRIVVLTCRGLEGLSRNLQVEFPDARLVEIKMDSKAGLSGKPCMILPNASRDCFDSVFQMKEKDEELTVHVPSQRVSICNTARVLEKQVVNEALADIREWDKPQDKYYAVHLKHFSPGTHSAKNGTIYANGVALPFSPKPEWEKIACGKIESGLAFISLAAYDQNAVYTADYLSVDAEESVRELVLEDKERQVPLMQQILQEADLCVLPEDLVSYADIFSRAGMNIVYRRVGNEKFAVRYEVRVPFAATGGFYRVIKQRVLDKVRTIVRVLRQSLGYAKKAGTVTGLWMQIIAQMAMASARRSFTGFIRISR